MAVAFFLTTLLLAFAIAISAKPVLERKLPLKLPLTELSILTNRRNVVERDRRRVKSFMRRAGDHRQPDDSGQIDIDAIFQVKHYSVVIGIGYPPTSYNLILDSGSANTWVGANKAYVRPGTGTSQQTNNEVESTSICGNVTAKFRGLEFIDQVTIGNFVINQSIGVASETQDFNRSFDGVLGIGPTGLTKGTLSPDRENTIPTVTDNLLASGLIDENLVAVAFKPFNNSFSKKPNDNIGEINFGGTNPALYIGDIAFAPITESSPANEAWGIDLSLDYGDISLLTNAAGIVDTSATFLYLDSDAYNAYKDAIRAKLDPITGLLTIPPPQFNQLKEMKFTISNVEFTLIPDAQIMPQHLNVYIGGVTNQLYLAVNDIGTLGGPFGGGSFKFIFGKPVLERFYCVFDFDNQQVGFANTPSTLVNLNVFTRFVLANDAPLVVV